MLSEQRGQLHERLRRGSSERSLLTARPRGLEHLECLEQETGENLNLQVSKDRKKLKPPSLVVQARALVWHQSPACWHPQGTCLQKGSSAVPGDLPHWDQGSCPPAESPAATAVLGQRADRSPLSCPPFPGETDSCLTATWQDNLRQEMKTDSHH